MFKKYYLDKLNRIMIKVKRSARGVVAQRLTVNGTVVSSIPDRENKIVSIPRPGNKPEHGNGNGFHSIHNVLKIRLFVRNGMS